MGVHLPRRIAFLADYPPRLCGIATFTYNLYQGISAIAPESNYLVCAVNDRNQIYEYPSYVRCEIEENNPDSYRQAADFLNSAQVDLLCVQHEFGIYGGTAGRYLLKLLKDVRMPIVTTLHTILKAPDPAKRLVMDELLQRSDRIIVMAEKGVEILQETYGISPSKIDLIGHGIPDIPFMDSRFFKAQFGIEGRFVLLTFGLLGPGKGIEYVISALPDIVRQNPNVVYLILGATHPHLVAREGEAYRESLEKLAEDLGVKDHIIFHNRFVSDDDLKEFIGATDIYITPYLNEAQITSGTLAYVFGAGKAVISTPYWHAQELLAHNRGTLVPFRDSVAIAQAVCDYLDHPDQLAQTRQNAYALGRKAIWPAVAAQYLRTFELACYTRQEVPQVVFGDCTITRKPIDLPEIRLDHILKMTDNTGIFQHAVFTIPNYDEGYCTDDNARAFLLCALLENLNHPAPRDTAIDCLATTYLAFLSASFNRDTGRFRNFMTHSRQWLEEIGSEDSHGRALWALGTGARRAHNDGHRTVAATIFEEGLEIVDTFSSPRAWAFTLLGLHDYLHITEHYEKGRQIRLNLTQKLLTLWKNCATTDWPWCEISATYDNARLCQALILSGHASEDEDALQTGLNALSWLASLQTAPEGHFRPIGNNGFYRRDSQKAFFDQQPVEAQAMVSACLDAFRITQDPTWMREAHRAFDWFRGNNDLGLPLYDIRTGGCRDGLQPETLNENQGAESTLAFHLAHADMRYVQQIVVPPIGATL